MRIIFQNLLIDKRKTVKKLFILASFLAIFTIKTTENRADSRIEEKHIVVVTASYNNKKWYKKNLDSVFNQNYKNWRLIYIDDCSTDGTGDLVETYIQEKGFQNQVTLIKNKKRVGSPLGNQYYAIHSCKDTDIIIILDGDDWLAHDHVFSYINNVYQDPSVWLTYGTFKEHPSGKVRNYCKPVPLEIVTHNAFREFKFIPTHLRTFYAGLFKKINKKDLQHNGKIIKMAGDLAAMFPMLEMAQYNFKFIPDILLIYNSNTGSNHHTINQALQTSNNKKIRKKKRYNPIESPFK